MALKMVAKKPVVSVVALEEPPITDETVEIFHKVLVEQPAQIEQTEAQALAAEYIELWKKCEYFEVKPMVARMEEIRKSLVAIANESMDEKQRAIFSCSMGEIEFSERGKMASVPNPLGLIHALLLKFGPTVTTTVVDIALTPLRKLLSEFELKEYLVDQPGSRTLKAVRPV